MSPLRFACGIFATYACGYVAFGAAHYILSDPTHFDMLFRTKYVEHLALVRWHGGLGAITLALGALQFWSVLRGRFPALHRWMGRMYLTAVLAAAGCSIPMGCIAYGGLSSRCGFVLMGILWLYTGAMAGRTARQRRFERHRVWMLRNFALTLGALFLRIDLYWLQAAGYSFDTVYPIVTWLAWVPTLLLVEGQMTWATMSRMTRPRGTPSRYKSTGMMSLLS